MLFRSLIVLLVLGLGLALAACGDNQPTSTSPAATLAATTVATKLSPTPGNAVTATATADTNSSTTPISQKPGSTEQSLEFEGRNRTYVLHLPPAITSQKPLPLLLVFHGGEGQGKQVESLTGFSKMADQKGFIVAYPDGVNKNWNDGRDAPSLSAQRQDVNDVGFVSALIDELSHNLTIDQKRVFATGMSNGGIFSQRLGCELANKLAAIAPVAGTMPEKLAPNCKPARPLAVLMIHGTEDPLVPWQGGAVVNDRRGTVLSVPDTVKKWVTFDGCNATPITNLQPDNDPQDGTRVRREAYNGCKAGSAVILYAVEGGGHSWPGGMKYLPELATGKTSRDINASDIIWDFFVKHPLP